MEKSNCDRNFKAVINEKALENGIRIDASLDFVTHIDDLKVNPPKVLSFIYNHN